MPGLRRAWNGSPLFPWPPGCKKLVGGDKEWRIRAGDYRVVYEIDDAAKSSPKLWIARRQSSRKGFLYVHICVLFVEGGVIRVELEFEWDEKKAKANLTKHRISFLTAAEIFANEILERLDDREDYGEIRFIALGRVDADVYRVVFTWRSEKPYPHHQRPESEQR